MATIVPKSSRIHHLDALRGIASVAVAFHHTMDSFYGIPFNNGYIDSIAGKSAVFFFFLLSGFVLSGSLLKQSALKKEEIIIYFKKRFLRLYPAVFASLLFCILVTKVITPDVGWSDANWLQSYYNEILKITDLKDYLKEFFISDFSLNPPLWSIRVELACSFLLPFLIIFLKRFPFMMLPIGLLLALWFEKGIGFPKFMFLFYLGYLIQEYKFSISKISVRYGKSLLLPGTAVWLFSMAMGFDFLIESVILAFLFMLLVPCNWPWLKKTLEAGALLFLGRISYSFYLLHCPVLYFSWAVMKLQFKNFMSLNPPIIPAATLFIISTAITILIATICERFVEEPFNNIGKRLSSVHS